MLFFILFLFILLASRISCSPPPSLNGIVLRPEDYNVTWIYFPTGDGNLEIALLVKGTDDKRMNSRKSIEEQIKFELYTRANPQVPEIIEYLNLKEIQNTSSGKFNSFNKTIPTKIIIHGWKGETNNPIVLKNKQQYLKLGLYNIIAVNWDDISANNNYFEVVTLVPKVGQIVGNFINFLEVDLKVDPNLIHLIGHSLGAHVAGYAGKNSIHKVGRITGLDPARPLYEGFQGPAKRLNKTDGQFVDIIHTSAYIFGFASPIGDIDFYPNGGYPPQPGCFGLQMIPCSHGRAVEYFTESIASDKGFWAYPCDTYSDFIGNLCSNSSLLMGNDVPINSHGIYYLKTNSHTSYALGKL